MQHARFPLTRELVLVGGGHTHALVLRKWGMAPLPGARLTVINPGPTAPYSGMLPGFVAGHYTRDALDIDLLRLARFAGARLILGNAEGLDLEHRQVHVDGRPPIAFDTCSINIGITSDMPALPGFSEHAVPAKPLGMFAERWARYLERTGPAAVAVIGAGVAGVELAMAMAHALRTRARAANITILDSGQALRAIGDKAAVAIKAALSDLNVTLVENTTISRIEADGVRQKDDTLIKADFVTGAAGAKPYGWIAESGLDLTDGFIDVDPMLRTSADGVFAAGDCAHLLDSPRPKAGVFAVREAPVLFDNLCAALSGEPMRPYKPQNDYLKLISLGGKSALGERFGVTLSGPLMWQWKDHIDQKFMDQFRDLPSMDAQELPPMFAGDPAEEQIDKPMCAGCGAKVGRQALAAAIPTPMILRPDIHPLPGDDAALLQMGDTRQVISSDHLRAFVDDPVQMTRIAAVHALGDIWAMGAEPQAATANLILPRMSSTLQQRSVGEITAVANDVFGQAGAQIVGGHTSMGDEMTIGFTVTGLCNQDPITLQGGKAGDALILTKPLGSGVILAGDMNGTAKGDWVAGALNLMAQSQGQASAILRHAHAMTDVTGFGLVGHLVGLCEASGVGADLDLSAIPMMPGALELTEKGVRSSLFRDNAAIAPALPIEGKAALLFDPQTAGGLLAAVAPDKADGLLEQLANAGYTAARMGQLTGMRLQLSVRGN